MTAPRAAANRWAMMTAVSRSAYRALSHRVGTVDRVGVEERVAKFQTRSIKKEAKLWGLEMAIAMVDLTTLEGCDTPGKVAALCRKARRPHDGWEGPAVAAVCVYPAMVRHARKELAGSSIKLASVATAFPSGQSPLDIRLREVRQAVADGADEIDMVISRNLFLTGRFEELQDEIRSVVEACGEARLKVILEVGELETFDNIRLASFLAMEVLRPMDFIKTSTGKTAGNATLANTQVMLEAVRDYYLQTGKVIGIKPAGGIRTAKQALHYLVAVKETLGDHWLQPDLYRLGASSLLNDLLRQVYRLKTGSYPASYRFSEAS